MVHNSIPLSDWLKHASNTLADAMIPSARLDAELILAHTLNRSRTWLHAHGDEELDPRRRDIADARIELRLERVPVAYIIGHKEFYGRRFYVSPKVLIPRPESEALIDLLSSWLASDTAKKLVDVGTGSGCLGITAKCEHPDLMVTLTDTSKDALAIARKNARTLDADVQFLTSDLLNLYPLTADVIVSNLPYVDPEWDISADTKHEPSGALYADEQGLQFIKRLINQSVNGLGADGLLLLEADPRQHNAISDYAARHHFAVWRREGFAIGLTRRMPQVSPS